MHWCTSLATSCAQEYLCKNGESICEFGRIIFKTIGPAWSYSSPMVQKNTLINLLDLAQSLCSDAESSTLCCQRLLIEFSVFMGFSCRFLLHIVQFVPWRFDGVGQSITQFLQELPLGNEGVRP